MRRGRFIMAENTTQPTSIWGKIAGYVTDKGIDLVDSYAAIRLGKEQAKLEATQQTVTPATPAVSSPSASSAASFTKYLPWILGGVGVLAVVAILLRRPRR